MDSNGSEYRNIILISQVSISILVPIFACLALGIWIDGKFDTWFTIPLLITGFAAGGRNAYVLLMSQIKADEAKRKKKLEEEINRKVMQANQPKAKE